MIDFIQLHLLELIGLSSMAIGIGISGVLAELNDVISAAAGLKGRKPKPQDWKDVELGKAVAEVPKTVMQNWAAIRDLTQTSNQLSADELLKQLERISPGYSRLSEQNTKLIESQMRGELPDDLKRLLRQEGAEAGIAGGYGGSGFGRNITARNLGLTSLQLMQAGQGAFERWAGRAASMVPQFDFTRLFPTVGQALQNLQYNAEQTWNVDWLQEQLDAMPNPTQQALANFNYSIGQAGDQILGSYLGMGSALNTGKGSSPWNYGGGGGGGAGGGLKSGVGGASNMGGWGYNTFSPSAPAGATPYNYNFFSQQEAIGANMLMSGQGGSNLGVDMPATSGNALDLMGSGGFGFGFA